MPSFAVDMSSFAKLLGGFVSGLAGPDATDLPDFDDPDGWKIEVVQDGDVGYVRFPAIADQLPAGKSWIRADDGAGGRQGRLRLRRARAVRRAPIRATLLDSLRAVTSKIETVGTEELRGVETTHYRAVIDPAELAKLAPTGDEKTSQTLVDQLTAQSGLGRCPVDVWIDATGFVRKLSMSFSATQPGTTQSSEASMSFELWDYGESVDIDVPPASQVVDASAVRG